MKELCGRIVSSVSDAVGSVVGTPDSGEKVGMGADGTPTKEIDSVADAAALEVLEEEGGLRVISEESGETVFGEPELTVVLDPIDGTLNATREIPFYATSIAVSRDGTMSGLFYGYVYDLVRDDVYAASEDGKATKNGEPIKPTTGKKVSEICLTTPGYYHGFDPHRFKNIRSLGCTSLELCYTAEGKMDGYLDTRPYLRTLDIVGGKTIVEAAGGKVTDIDGKPIDGEISPNEHTTAVAAFADHCEKITEVLE
ncbi:MAG: inositol monophosphatase family protein [Halobacteria archaeon]